MGWPLRRPPSRLATWRHVDATTESCCRKSNSPDREPDRPSRALLSVRSALVLTVALLIGFGGAVLLYAAHRPLALVALGGLGFFGGALKLLDSMIELKRSRLILSWVAMTVPLIVSSEANVRQLLAPAPCAPAPCAPAPCALAPASGPIFRACESGPCDPGL